MKIAEMVREKIGDEKWKLSLPRPTITARTTFRRKRSDMIFGFVAGRSVKDAIVDLKSAFLSGQVPNSMSDDRYYNIKRMQALKLK